MMISTLLRAGAGDWLLDTYIEQQTNLIFIEQSYEKYTDFIILRH